MDLGLKDRVVIIGGGSKGLGRACADSLAQEGANLVICSRNAGELNRVAGEISAATGVEVLAVAGDLSQLEDIQALVKRTVDHYGRLDILVNNAGITGRPELQRFGTSNYETFKSVMNTNVRGPLKITEAFTAHVAASNEKKVAVVTSSEGSIAGVTSNRQPFYRASKAAVNMVMRNISHSLKDQGITVVLVNPGPVDTDMMARARGRMPLRTTERAVDEMVSVINGATLEQTAAFFHFDGSELPW